jgi:LPXTG-motif cell wall-anchored protein
VKKQRKKEGGLMQYRRITSVVLAILTVTALTAAGASAQSIPQQAQSGDIAMPTEVTGDDPVNISSNFETGNEQVRESHTVGPQPKKERRQRSERGIEDVATPTEAAPTEAAPTKAAPTSGIPASYSGGSGSGAPAPAPPPQPKAKAELPKTGGSNVASLFALGAGVLLVGAGLLLRRISK